MARVTFEGMVQAGKEQLATREFKVPEWGGEVLLRGLSKIEMDKIRERAQEGRDIDESMDMAMYERLVFLAGLVEPKLEGDQYDMLVEGAPGVIQKVLNQIFKLSKVGRNNLKEVGRNFPLGS